MGRATNPKIWAEEVPVPKATTSYVDEAVLEKLPPAIKVLGIYPEDGSYWARLAKIAAVDANGVEDNYFLKVHQGDHGKEMVSSEAMSMTMLYEIIPDMVAKPMGWGSYEAMENTHFFLCKYHEWSKQVVEDKEEILRLPDKKEFTRLIADFHRRTVSLNAKFGNSAVTFGGRNPQKFSPSDTWLECFTSGMATIFAAERQTQGPDEELEQLEQAMLNKVFPRLIGALETGGRKITPCLVHGDLWEGNASVEKRTGKPMIFDATPLYAHNEYELGPWMPPRHAFFEYIDEYREHIEDCKSQSENGSGTQFEHFGFEPAKEFKDRVAMYWLRFELHGSSLYPGNLFLRNNSKDIMPRLLERYEADFPAVESNDYGRQ